MMDVVDSVYSAHDMRWFSALDIERAYYQLPVAEESRDFTAFSTQRSHYRFRCLSFGLKKMPRLFSNVKCRLCLRASRVNSWSCISMTFS